MIPPPLNPGDPLYAAWLNQLRDAVLAEIVGDGDVVVRRAGSRLTVGLARRIPGVQTTLFPVKVQKDGGSDGDGTTAATWTYTVTSLSGVQLGTKIELARPRPEGKMTFQEGSDGYGIAFYDGDVLKLWDAGEVPTTRECEGS